MGYKLTAQLGRKTSDNISDYREIHHNNQVTRARNVNQLYQSKYTL